MFETTIIILIAIFLLVLYCGIAYVIRHIDKTEMPGLEDIGD